MRMTSVLLTAVALAAAAAYADKRVDEAVARAESQIQKGRPEEAIKTVEKAVSQQPASPEAHLALARIHWRVGNVEEGAASATKAAELSSTAPPVVKADVLSTVSGLTLLRGAGKDALEHAKKAVEAQESPATLAALARAQVRTQQNTAALETAQKAAQAGPNVAAAQHALGEALVALRRNTEAEAALRKAIELDPKLTVARNDLAWALLGQGKAKEAMDEARKATEVDARSGEAFAVLGTAILAENKNNWSDAIAQAQQGAFLNPRNPVVQVAVARIFEAQGNFDQATSAYRRALEADPGYVPARSALIYLQVRRGELDAALAETQKLVTDVPDSADAQLHLGRILMRKGDFQGALEPLEKAAKGDPQNAEAHALLGTAYQYTRQSDDAFEAYKKAVQLAPDNMTYKVTYGLLLGLNKQYAEGVAELRKVIASPGYKDAAAYVNLGWIYRNMEPSKPEDSVAAYRKALELDAKNEQAALGMGWALAYLRRYDEGIAAFRKAIELEPQTAGEAYDGIAWSYFFKKDLASAKQNLEKAKTAGRNDARLASNIEKTEKGTAEAQEKAEEAFREAQRARDEPDVNTFGNQIMRGSPAARKSAARQLRQFGRAAVEFLIFAAVNDKDFDVREEAINSLGAIGGPARDQCRQLSSIANSNPYEQTVMDRKTMEASVRYEDLRRAARAAVRSIGCN